MFVMAPALGSYAIHAEEASSDDSSNVNNGPKILALNGVFIGLALVTVLGRMYVRLVMLRSMGIDDWFMVLAMVLGIATYICLVGEVQNGMGTHIDFITTDSLQKILHWEFFHSIIIMAAVGMIKVSIAFFLLRLVPQKNYRRFLCGMIIFLFAYTLACALSLVFYCIPVAGSWDFAVAASGKCYSQNAFTALGLFNSSVNIATDVIFAVLPIPIVLGLQVNKRTKVSLVVILSLGLFACVAAIVKTVYQSQLFSTPDWYFNDYYMTWNVIELSIGILASSLPILRPLFTSILGSTRAFSGSGSRRTKSTGTPLTKLSRFNNTGKKSGYFMQNSQTEFELSTTNRGDIEAGKSYNVQVTTSARQPYGNKSVSSSRDKDVSGDDSSEDGILPLQNPSQRPVHNQIVRTTEVTIH